MKAPRERGSKLPHSIYVRVFMKPCTEASQMRGSQGFSLAEMMVSVLVLLMTMSAVFYVLGRYQKSYQGEQMAADLHSGVRNTMELISQEVGQAGFFGFTTLYTQDAIVGGSTQTVNIGSTASIFAGETLVVDSGAAQETITVSTVNSQDSITAAFAQSHAPRTPINAFGAFPEGIIAGSSTPIRLQLFGDINDDGALVYVEYNVTGGTLTRSITPIGALTQNPSQVLVRNVVANPSNTAVFRYSTPVVQNGRTYVTNVWVTLTTQSADKDPQTQQLRTMTSSLVVAPRNVVAALDLAVNNITNRLQAMPPGLPIPAP